MGSCWLTHRLPTPEFLALDQDILALDQEILALDQKFEEQLKNNNFKIKEKSREVLEKA